MQRLGPKLLLSATDLVNFHECEHLSALDLAALDDQGLRAQKSKPDEHTELLFKRGNEFEAAYLAQLKQQFPKPGQVIEITKHRGDPARSAAETLEALRTGADYVYQATFLDGDLVGHADFLRKVPGRPSALGDYSYEVIDTKLGRTPKASYVLQLAFYGDLLAKVQQAEPHAMHVVLGTHEHVSFTCSEYSRYFRRLLTRFTQAVGNGAIRKLTTAPRPCSKCPQCHWNDRCTQQRVDADSLFQMAGIRATQVTKLEASGVKTIEALAKLSPTQAIPHLAAQSLTTLSFGVTDPTITYGRTRTPHSCRN